MEKVCGRCKQSLPLAAFYGRADRQSLTSKCKTCFSAYQREYKSRPDVRLAQRPKRAAWQKAAAEVGRNNLSAWYLKKLLVQKTTLKFHQIPRALVEAKQVQIMITRQLKDEK